LKERQEEYNINETFVANHNKSLAKVIAAMLTEAGAHKYPHVSVDWQDDHDNWNVDIMLLQDKKAAMKLALIKHEIEGMNITVTHPVLEQARWTFINSMFFCCSLYTSIGESEEIIICSYGHLYIQASAAACTRRRRRARS
jgi:hypothetical protein